MSSEVIRSGTERAAFGSERETFVIEIFTSKAFCMVLRLTRVAQQRLCLGGDGFTSNCIDRNHFASRKTISSKNVYKSVLFQHKYIRFLGGKKINTRVHLELAKQTFFTAVRTL